MYTKFLWRQNKERKILFFLKIYTKFLAGKLKKEKYSFLKIYAKFLGGKI
jgi:hypothetical protein